MVPYASTGKFAEATFAKPCVPRVLRANAFTSSSFSSARNVAVVSCWPTLMLTVASCMPVATATSPIVMMKIATSTSVSVIPSGFPSLDRDSPGGGDHHAQGVASGWIVHRVRTSHDGDAERREDDVRRGAGDGYAVVEGRSEEH